MRINITILSIMLLLLTVITSCYDITDADNRNIISTNEIEERIIIEDFGFKDLSMGYQIADLNNIEAVTEISTQAVICEVKALDDTVFTETGVFAFTFEIEIKDILMDINNRLSIGDHVLVMTNNGLISANEAHSLVGNTSRAKKLGILQNAPYAANEYVLCSVWDGIPMEVGKTYLIFMTDSYLPESNIYSETSYAFMYEISGGAVKHTRDMMYDIRNTSQVVADIKAQIALRSGRVDDIGIHAYIEELGQRQAADRNNEIAQQQ